MLLILIAFVAFLVKHRRKERFERSILIWMTLKYAIALVIHFWYYKESELERNILYGLYFSAGSISLWIYAS